MVTWAIKFVKKERQNAKSCIVSLDQAVCRVGAELVPFRLCHRDGIVVRQLGTTKFDFQFLSRDGSFRSTSKLRRSRLAIKAFSDKSVGFICDVAISRE